MDTRGILTGVLVIEHREPYNGDHHGGVKDVSTRIPIEHFVDHGPRVQDPLAAEFAKLMQSHDRTYAGTRGTAQRG